MLAPSITPVSPGHPLEPTMSNTSRRSQSSMGIVPSPAGSAMSASSAFAGASSREDAEWERRWQLEWDRRNVED
jgi:hypothetical protein